MMNEQYVKMAARLYQCRDTAKSLAKLKAQDYKIMIQPYINIINKIKLENKIDTIPALLQISELQFYQDDGMVQLLFMAATVEIIEPSEN